MKRVCTTVFVGMLTVGVVQVWAQQAALTDARQAAQDEVVRRQEAQVAGVNLINQGEQLYYQGQYTDAAAKLEEGLKILPRAPVTEIDYNRGSRFLSDAYYRLGDAAHREGNVAKAKELAEKSLKADPTNRSADSLLHKAKQVERLLAEKAKLPPAPPEEPRLDKTAEFVGQKAEIKKLFREGQILFNSGQFDEAEKRFKQIIAIDRYNDDAFVFLKQLNEERFDAASKGAKAVRAQRLWEVTDAWTPAVRKESAALEKQAVAGPINTSSAQTAETTRKLNEIVIPEINFRDAVIADVVNFLTMESRRLDPQKNGVNILLGAGAGGVEAAPVPAPVPVEGVAPPPTETGGRRITLSLRNVPLIDALKYVTSLVGLKYRIEPNAVLILPEGTPEGGMITRSYPVSAGAIRTVLSTPTATAATPGVGGAGETYRAFGGGGATMGSTDVKALFTDLGVQFPTGSSIGYSDRTSMVIVRNTPENMEIFERVLATLNVIPSQVEIETKFIDISQSALDELGFDWNLGGVSPVRFGRTETGGPKEFGYGPFNSNLRSGLSASALDAALGVATGGSSVLGSFAGILTDPTFSVIIKALAQKGDSDLLSAPKITTISGQQAQIKVVQEFIYPSRYSQPQVASGGNGGGGVVGPSIPEEFKTRELGVLLNVTPTVGADGNTINLTLVPEVSEFLGYLSYSTTSTNEGGATYQQPLFSTRTLTTSVIIWDGQTVVLGGLLREDVKTLNDKVPFLGDIPWVGRLFQSKSTSRTKRNLLIFVTARLVDPAGNAINRSSRKVGM